VYIFFITKIQNRRPDPLSVISENLIPENKHKSRKKRACLSGINGRNFDLYQSYLDNRYVRTLIHNGSDNKVSGWTKLYGVLQGSVLGPLLFLIYTNDLPNLIKITSLPVLFADDTSILFAQSNLTELNNIMNSIFETVNDWFRAN
jgi:hypothetical protein